MFNLVKFYAWLEDNETTPFCIKLNVLYACMFKSILHSAEAWGNVDEISEKILKIERQALRRCLQVKSGTTNEIIYMELNRPDIISTIKDHQFSFREKITSLDPSEALVRNIWDMCDSEDGSMKKYYLNLTDNNRKCNIEEKKQYVLKSFL